MRRKWSLLRRLPWSTDFFEYRRYLTCRGMIRDYNRLKKEHPDWGWVSQHDDWIQE